MEIWSKCDICGRDIPVGELCYGLKKGNCICKDCCTGFENCTFTLAPMSTLTPPNEPLTWKELSNMVNKPVYIVELERPKRNYWALVHQVSDTGAMFTSTVDLHNYRSCELYGKSWLTYAYPPIDREKWEPCSECVPNCSWCKYYNEELRHMPKVCEECKNKNNYESEYKFCYECGRPLTKEAWELLEKRIRR